MLSFLYILEKMYIPFLLIVFIAGLAHVESHGFLRRPTARTSIQREPQWGATPPFFWDHTGVFCGNVTQDLTYSTCGRCGDAPGYAHSARGGRYDKGIIVATYTTGEVIETVSHMSQNHRGHIEFDLCLLDDDETDNCFKRLQIVGGSMPIREGNMMCTGEEENIDVIARLQLPANFRCSRCTLRWTYRTAFPPAIDPCFDPNPAQTFRNCADIRIE